MGESRVLTKAMMEVQSDWSYPCDPRTKVLPDAIQPRKLKAYTIAARFAVYYDYRKAVGKTY